MDRDPAEIEAAAAHEWRIRVERRLDDRRATGEVVVSQEQPPDPQDPPHRALAGARAWLALGEEAQRNHGDKTAIAAARSGLDELGQSYARPGTKDDTRLKLLAAEDLIQDGRTTEGATLMLRMLADRVELYRELHRAAIVT